MDKGLMARRIIDFGLTEAELTLGHTDVPAGQVPATTRDPSRGGTPDA
jgi:hypothetical protein